MARSTILTVIAVAAGICCQPLTGAVQPGSEPAGTTQRIITWEVEASGGVRAQLRARPGEAVHLTRPDGTEVAMIPRLSDDGSGAVSFEVYEVTGPLEKQVLRRVDVIEALPGATALSRTVADLSLRLVGSRPAEPAPARDGAVGESPASDRLVRWTLTLGDGRLIKLVGMDGMLTRVRLADGRTFGFMPVIQDEKRLAFRVFAIERDKVGNGGEILHPLEKFEMSSGGEFFPHALENSLIKVGSVERVSPEAWRAAFPRTPVPQTKVNCCVACDGVRVCGCSVSMDCGDCCAPPCCFWEF